MVQVQDEMCIRDRYYSGQFSEPGRFTEEEWDKLVKSFDLQILNRVHCHEEKYNIVHICGEAEHNFTASPQRLSLIHI